MSITETAGSDLDSPPASEPTDAGSEQGIDEVIDEVLVEEISIDGMCGVY